MTLEQLRIFLAVAERQHMTRAAASLNLSQSAVSARINALEADLGVKLFDRTGRNIHLTEPGQCLLVSARAVLNHADQVRRAVIATAERCRRAASVPPET